MICISFNKMWKPFKTIELSKVRFWISLQPDWPIEQWLFYWAKHCSYSNSDRQQEAQSKDFSTGSQKDFNRGLVSSEDHSDFLTNSYGESWDSSCEKSWVPVHNQCIPVKKKKTKKQQQKKKTRSRKL